MKEIVKRDFTRLFNWLAPITEPEPIRLIEDELIALYEQLAEQQTVLKVTYSISNSSALDKRTGKETAGALLEVLVGQYKLLYFFTMNELGRIDEVEAINPDTPITTIEIPRCH